MSKWAASSRSLCIRSYVGTMDSRSSWQRTRQEGALDAEALASSAVVAKIRRRRQVNATGGSKADVDVAELSMTGNPPPVDGKHQSTNIRFGNDIRAAPRDCIHDCAESPECRLFFHSEVRPRLNPKCERFVTNIQAIYSE